MSNLKTIFTARTKIRRNQNLTVSEMDREKVMLDVERGEYYALNEWAAAVWDHAGDLVTVGEMIQKLIEEYEVDYEQCLIDLQPFLQDMQSKKLIEVVN